MAVKGLNQKKKTKKKRNDDDDDDDDDGHLAHLTYNIARSTYTLFHAYTEYINKHFDDEDSNYKNIFKNWDNREGHGTGKTLI